MRLLSLRSAFLFVGTALAGVALLLALVLGGTVLQLGTLARAFADAVDSLRAVEEIQVNLLTATREHRIYRQTGDERWLEEAREAEADLLRWLGAARELVRSPEERALVDRLAVQVNQVRRDVLNAPPGTRLAPWPEITEAIADAEALIRLNEQVAAAAVRQARRWSEIAAVVAATGVLLLVASLVAVVIFNRRFVYLPVLHLRQALAHRSLDSVESVPEQGPLELREIAADINALIQRLAAQREQQLAFLSAIAHDLRTPMTSLRTSAQLVARQPDPEKQKERATVMTRQVDRMNRLVEDLLEVSRVESGRFTLQIERADLRAVVSETWKLFADLSDRHEVRCELPEEPLLVDHDTARVSQILSNFLSNAIKFSPSGGPVEIRLRASGGRALIEVSDRGLGIPADEIETLFEPFRRGKGPRGEIPGVGLGLSVARRLARAHGGEIEVESEPDRGSTFRLVLPLPDAPA